MGKWVMDEQVNANDAAPRFLEASSCAPPTMQRCSYEDGLVELR